LHGSKRFLQRWSTLLFLPGIREKNFSFHFKHNNLTIHVVKFCKTNSTYSPSSLGQDPTVESEKINKTKRFIWACLAKNGSFGVVFEKKGLSWRP
jgi:hypothetical protein